MEIDSILKSFQHFGIHLGLERIKKLLASLGNPHHTVPVVHVGGTNGKGSVCAYLSAILTEAGYRVGRYTSPHLVDWNERICLNEQPIATDVFQELLLQVKAAITQTEDSPTQFEVITAAAWLYFAQQQVDIAVVEVGLGGRLDATNVCDRPLVSIITSISREHWQQLGPTLADIAREKAGILKPECPAVIGQVPPEAAAVFSQRIKELNCPVIFPQPAKRLENSWAEYQIEDYQSNPKSSSVAARSAIQNPKFSYPLPLNGDIQLNNSALAIAALQILANQGWKISPEIIVSGIAKTKWPGRLQWTTWHNHSLLIDGAHNPEAAIALRQYVDSLNKSSVNWVMGILSTKDRAEIFQALLKRGDRLYLVPVPDPTSAHPQDLAQIAQEICPELAQCQTYTDLNSGLIAATARPSQDNLVVLCGSLYLLGYFLRTID